MNRLNNCIRCWHCASGSCKDQSLQCSNGILPQDIHGLHWQILTKVAYRDPEYGSLAICQQQDYMPHKCQWGKFKAHVFFNCCLDDQFWNARFDLQQLKLWILFTWHTAMAYGKWKWKIDHWLMKSTQHSLPSPQPPSTIVCWPGKQVSLGSCQSLVQEVEHNVSVIQEILITHWIMHALMDLIIATLIFVLPRQGFMPEG